MFIVSRTSKPPDSPRSTSSTTRRRRQSQGRCKPSAPAAPGVIPLHVDSRGSSWIACGTTWTRRQALAIGGASWTLMPSFSTRPRRENSVLNGLFPDTPYPRLLTYQPNSLLRESLKFCCSRNPNKKFCIMTTFFKSRNTWRCGTAGSSIKPLLKGYSPSAGSWLC
jgi:hypothetical protein